MPTRCRLCGECKQLTYEHVPPKSAYNREPLKSYSLSDYWALSSGKPATYVNEQRGAGYYATCASCNSNSGTWYVGEFARWVEAGAEVVVRELSTLRANAERPSDDDIVARMKLRGTYPGRFAKQVVAMLLAINAPSLGDAHPGLLIRC